MEPHSIRNCWIGAHCSNQVPRVFQLDVPAVLHDPLPVPSLETNDTKAPEGDLLALGGPQDEDLLLHSRSTKGWVSPDGGAGYFLQFPGILMDIAILTGTEISVSEDAKAIQVSGNNESDANDALAKISRVYGPIVRARPLPSSLPASTNI